MTRSSAVLVLAIALVSAYPVATLAKGPAMSAVMPASGLKWVDAGIPGVSTAAAHGDMKKGAGHFFLKYAAGFKAPLHYHSPDHYVVTVSGNLVLVVDGKENSLPPGSYFSLRNKAPHAARCEGAQDCVMFVDARAPWNVVPVEK